MLRIFEVSFLVGTIYTVISFILGQLFDFVDLDGDIDFDGDLTGINVSPLKPIVIVAFVTVFGGIGTIVMKIGFGALIALVVALLSGLFIAFIMYKFIVVPLYRAQNTSSASQKELIGMKAIMKLGAKDEQFGRITYVINGNSYSSPAKSVDGKEIHTNEDVVIIDIKKNVFFVDKL